MLDLRNCDCMELMASFNDGHFDLAIVDPPYGLGDKKLTQGGTWALKYKSGDANWDIPPGEEYFKELFRVSKNQIIWGGNYFNLPPARCFIIWDKITHLPTMADCEFAWTSFDKNAKIIKCMASSNKMGDKRIHITQKPVFIYEWILTMFAKPGYKILDTHMGSGSIGVACHNFGFDLWASEINKEYYQAAMARISDFKSQEKLFHVVPDEMKQQNLFGT